VKGHVPNASLNDRAITSHFSVELHSNCRAAATEALCSLHHPEAEVAKDTRGAWPAFNGQLHLPTPIGVMHGKRHLDTDEGALKTWAQASKGCQQIAQHHGACCLGQHAREVFVADSLKQLTRALGEEVIQGEQKFFRGVHRHRLKCGEPAARCDFE
jgi:hypothetical protein